MSFAVRPAGPAQAPGADEGPCIAQAATLLPDAPPFSADVAGDAMSALYTMLSQQRQNTYAQGQEQVTENTALREQALKAQEDAIQREEQDRPHGFLCDLEKIALDVAKVAAVVGSVAVTVATAGAASPILVCAAIALSIGGTVVSETHCFGGASSWVGLGLTLAGAGAGMWLSAGASCLSVTGQIVATGGRVCEGVAGAADVVGGTAHIVNGEAQARVQEDLADETLALQHGERLARLTAWVIAELRTDDKTYQGAQQSLQSAIQTSDQIPVGIAHSIRG